MPSKWVFISLAFPLRTPPVEFPESPFTTRNASQRISAGYINVIATTQICETVTGTTVRSATFRQPQAAGEIWNAANMGARANAAGTPCLQKRRAAHRYELIEANNEP